MPQRDQLTRFNCHAAILGVMKSPNRARSPGRRSERRKPFLHVDDASVGDCFPPGSGDLHPHDLHLPTPDGHVAHFALRKSPEHQIGDLIELESMRQYHWFGAAARVPRQEPECA
jgi:hypothetical protein